MKPAAFLDRDGVINLDKGHIYKISDFEWVHESMEAIKFLNEKGYYIFVVTNQSGISRKLYTVKDMKNLHNYIEKELEKINAYIDDFFYSPYHPDYHLDEYAHLKKLRKPDIGMLELASIKWEFDKNKSFLIGDSDTDIECAKKFGIDGHLFKEGSLLNFIREKISS